jgi:hypothetical protein
VLLSGIQVLIDGFNVFVFQNPLINLLPYVNEKKTREGKEEVEMKLGFDLQCVPFPSRWNIFSSSINQIFASVYSLLSAGKGKKNKNVYKFAEQIFLLTPNSKEPERVREGKIKEINICHL